MKPLGIIHSLDMTRTAVVYKEKTGFTVATRKANGNETDFSYYWDVFSACDAARERVK